MLAFRPHHFLCTLCFQGKGYSPNFIHNYQKIITELKSQNGDNTVIKVVNQTDSICAPCPHKRELNCTSQEKIANLDANHAKILNLQEGDILTWGEAKQLLKKNMSVDKFHAACASCSWKQYGICENTLRELQDTRQ